MDDLTRQPEAVEIIRQAIEGGREVIPFLGAGLSAGSGFPLINELRDYLCKVRFLIETGVYRYLLGESPGEAGKVRSHDAGSPQYNPARYIDCFGWPGVNQIDADLSSYIENYPRSDDCGKWVNDLIPPDDKTEWGTPGPQWGAGRWRLMTAVHYVVLKEIDFHDTKLRESIADKVRGLKLKPRTDWFRYLLDLSGGRRGLIDTLFTQLNARREPSLGHIMLAHLAREFGWRLHLTINFDTLLETAFRRERLKPNVFEVIRDTQPPDPNLINGSRLALVKLHGGSYDLRIGEPLDYSLDGATREHVFSSVPRDALLLVLGFSGDERRMMQLIEDLTLRPAANDASRAGGQVRLLWMHWETRDRLPKTMTQLRDKLHDIGRGAEFYDERLSDAGTFLLQTYQHLTNSLPAGAQPYSALPKHVLSSKDEDEKKEQEQEHKGAKGATKKAGQDSVEPSNQEAVLTFIGGVPAKPIHLFARDSLKAGDHPKAEGWMPRPGLVLDDNLPSRQMSRFVQTLNEYHVIWIDLEDHHTLAGIVGEIIRKMRIFDPHLSDLILPLDDDPNTLYHSQAGAKSGGTNAGGSDDGTQVDGGQNRDDERPAARFEKSVRFIVRALKRGRYALVFDSLEGYGREQTGHHGIPWHVKGDRSNVLIKRHELLINFLESLIKHARDSDIDWCCCISADEPSYRHIVPKSTGDTDKGPLTVVREHIKGFCSNLLKDLLLQDLTQNESLPEPSCPWPEGTYTGSKSNPSSWLERYCGILERLHVMEESFAARCEASLEKSGFLGEDKGSMDRAIASVLDGTREEEPDELAVFLVLTSFRRPRCRAAVHAVLHEFFVADRVERGEDQYEKWLTMVLEKLQKVKLLRPMDGGYFWILHHAHEWTYKLLSEPARWHCVEEDGGPLEGRPPLTGSVKDDWKDPAPGDPKDPHPYRGELRIGRLIFLVSVHSRIAKFYYTDVFKRAKDIAGMYEYIYHRVTAVNYITTLRKALLVFEGQTAIKDFEAASTRITKQIKTLCDREGIDPPKPQAGVAGLRERVESCHHNYLRRLLNVLNRDEQAVLSSGTADTWLAWIETLKYDIERFDDRGHDVAAGPADHLKPGEVAETPADPADRPASADRKRSRVRAELDWKLRELEVRLYREKGAREKCVEAVFRLIFTQFNRWNQLIRAFLENGPANRDQAVVRLPDGARGLVKKWEQFYDDYRQEAGKRESQSGGDGPSGGGSQGRRLMDVCVEFGDAFFNEEILVPFIAIGVHRYRSSNIARIIRHFFWSFQHAYTCLRHDPSCSGKIMAWMTRSKRWIADLRAVVGDSDNPESAGRKPAGLPKVAPLTGGAFLELETLLRERSIEFMFDHCRFMVERHLSRPFTRRRFSAFGQRHRKSGDTGIWKFSRKLKDRIDTERKSAFGITFARERRLFRSQCEMRNLAAQCSAFLEDFDTAFRDLALALSGLDPVHPDDGFLCAVVQGVTAEVHLLTADSLIRRRYDANGAPQGRMVYSETVRAKRSAAFKQLSLASTALDVAETHLRAVRPNASRWEWLYEIRAQLVIERMLLRAVDLDFGIDPPADDWRFIGALQQDMAEGLEAIRAGLDCTMQPGYVKRGPAEDEQDDLSKTYKCLVSLWLQLMMASFWVFRVFSMNAAHRPQVHRDSGLAPLLGTVQMFDTHGSRPSFTKRWHALNRAAGLERYTKESRPENRGAHGWEPWDWAKEALELGNTPRDFYVIGVDERVYDDHPAFLREFILEKTRKVLKEPYGGMKKSLLELFLGTVWDRSGSHLSVGPVTDQARSAAGGTGVLMAMSSGPKGNGDGEKTRGEDVLVNVDHGGGRGVGGRGRGKGRTGKRRRREGEEPA
ncbi:MAG: hypothetical protein P4L84_19595 [Isosphaeraceae bacterium]|nr:hypothetical protein [Isosphaeraceae bacterium]